MRHGNYKVRNRDMWNSGKMSVACIYSGRCCPDCGGQSRRRHRGINSKRKTIRTHRNGIMI